MENGTTSVAPHSGAYIPYGRRHTRYVVLVVIVCAMLIHIEMGLALKYAPETVLVQVTDDTGVPQEDGECFADILAGSYIEKKKPLKRLGSIYEVINPKSFFANTDRGFHVLETGLSTYQKSFEIRLVCYTADFKGVSYTIINEHNQSSCNVQDGGKVLVC